MTDWPVKTLGDLFEFKNGRGFKKTEWSTSGLPIIRIQNLNSDSASYNYFSGTFDEGILVKSGDLLFSWSGSIGTSFGPHVWRRSSGLLNQHIFKVSPKVPMNTDYAHYCLRVITAEIERSVNGAVGLVHITKEKLNKFEIPVPPLEEQKRIVALLDAATARVTELTACYEQARTHANNLFTCALSSALEGNPDWPVKTLGDLLEVSIGGIWGNEAGEDEVDVFVYRSTELIKDGQLKEEITVRRSVTARQLDSRKLEEGDLLLEKSGGGPKTPVGRVGLVKVLPGLSVCSNFMQLMRPRKKDVLPVYLHYFLNHFHVAGHTEDLQNNSTNIRNLKTTEYMEVEIPVPPLEEQKRIVALLDAATARVTDLTACYEQARAHANDLLESSFLELFAEAFESHPKRKMGEVLQIARGGSPRPISEFITNSPKGVNWIKIGDASSSTKYICETAQKIKPEGVSRSRMVYPGDFLLSNSMSFGRPYIMKTEGCIHDGWLVLRDSKGELDQDFLFYLLSSRFMYQRFSQLAAGSTVQNLNSALVSSVEIPVPPIDFQMRIAEKARLIEENVARLNEVNEIRLQRATDLRQSILEAAFAGNL